MQFVVVMKVVSVKTGWRAPHNYSDPDFITCSDPGASADVQAGGSFHKQLTSKGKLYDRQQSVQWQRAYRKGPSFIL